MKISKLVLAVGVLVLVAGSLSFSAQPERRSAPAVVVKGLAMLQLEDPEALRIALPDAPGHKATITLVMHDGATRVLPFKGRGAIDVVEPGRTAPEVRVPELVRVKELYGEGARPFLNRAKNVISIPWSAIRKVSTNEVSASRYTFIRTDSGEELYTFRPRQVAESVRIDLTSNGTLNFNRSNTTFDSSVRVIRVEHAPENVNSRSPILEHFHHYTHYFDRPAGKMFDVEPKKLSGGTGRTPRVGNSFWVDQYIWCWLFGID